MTLRCAVIGAGRWGTRYAETLRSSPHWSLTEAVDLDPDARERCRAQFPDLVVTSSLSQRVDAVIIATPTRTHADLAEEHLLRGHHVLVEKPMATCAEDAERLIRAATFSGRVLFVGHLTLQSAGQDLLRRVLASSLIGRPERLIARRTSLGAKHNRESAVLALGPHDLANLYHLLGAVPVGGPPIIERYAAPSRETGALTLRFDDGPDSSSFVADFAWSRDEPTPARRTTVFGPLGSATFDEVHSVVTLCRLNEPERYLTCRDGEPLLSRQCARFADAIEVAEPAVIHGGCGRFVVRILEQIAAFDAPIERPFHQAAAGPP